MGEMNMFELLEKIRWDIRINSGLSFDSIRSIALLIEIRLEEYIYGKYLNHSWLKIIWYLCRFAGSIFQWILCNSNIPGNVKIGKGLRLPHPQNIIIVYTAEIGDFCMIYQNCTIARNGFQPIQISRPKIGDHVLVGANSIVLGNIEIGNDVLIGAGTIVNVSVPNYSRVVGGKSQISNRKPSENAAEPGSERHIHDPYSIWR